MNTLRFSGSPEHPSRAQVPSRPSFEDELGAAGSSGSDASSLASNVTTVSAVQTTNSNNSTSNIPGTATASRPPLTSSITTTSTNSSNTSSTTNPSAAGRPVTNMPQNESLSRKPTTLGRERAELQRHRSRHHSQGFFEPSLPTASSSDATLSASRIAAQAAMQQQQQQQQQQYQQPSAQQPPRRPRPISQESEDNLSRNRRTGSDSPPPPPPPPLLAAPNIGNSTGPSYQNGLVGGNTHVATTAANVAFPRSPGLQPPAMTTELVPEKEQKQKGEKKKRLFPKPKHIGIGRDKDAYKDRGMPSPSKMSFASASGLSRIVSASTTTLDTPPLPSNNPSMYNLSNASASTVVPADKPASNEEKKDKEKEKDKDKDKEKAHKHHFLSRQKLKLKDRVDDHHNLPLSSAWSNSKPSDPNAPQSLYSFIPQSPGTVSTTFGKSVSGLDILHGGRALREKKKEEKALAESELVDGLVNATGSNGTPAVFPGPSSLGSSTGILAEAALRETLQGFGLNNMTPEDAWDFLKAKLLVIFDGEDVRIAIEDLNKLVLIHIQRCVQKRTPTAIIDDLRELLDTGFASLNHNLSGVPDEKLVPHLVQIWMLTFGTILPFIQAVFLPLDLEFKGCGSVMSLREANEFWSGTPTIGLPYGPPGVALEVRNLVLTAFRDMVIVCRYESLLNTFSRLSLDSINLGNSGLSVTTTKSSSNSGRPGTATSLDGGFGSYSSQSSTLLNAAAGSYSSDSMSDNRSRAASNTSSNPDQLIFQSFSPAQRPTIIHRSSSSAPDTSHLITETVGRMLQCVSVLASVQTGDDAQEKIEVLSKALKHNWLGRGRTGRDRRGFVGAKIRPTVVARTNSDESTKDARFGDFDFDFGMQSRRREMVI